MFGSSVIAPVTVCTFIAAGLPAPNPADSPVFSPTAMRTSTVQLTSMDSVDWNKPSLASAAATSSGSLPFGLPQVLAIMTAIAAFNPSSAATMEFINKELLEELAEGTPLGEAMVNISMMLSPSSGDGPGSPLAPILDQIGPMLALAPTVVGGAMTVLAAIPEAVIPVVGAVVVGVFNAAAAAGSDGFLAAVEAGLYGVMNAAAQGIATMVNVVKSVLQNIAGVVNVGSTSSTTAAAVATGAQAVGAAQAGTTSKNATQTSRAAASAKGVAGPRPRNSTSQSASVGSGPSTGSAQRSTTRAAHPSGVKRTAKSAR